MYVKNLDRQTMSKLENHPHHYRSQIEWTPIRDPIDILVMDCSVKIPLTYNALRLQFNLYNRLPKLLDTMNLYKTQPNISLSSNDPQFNGVHNLQCQQVITFPQHCPVSFWMITNVLKTMGVPETEQPSIVAKIFKVVGNIEQPQNNVSINVNIYDDSLRLHENVINVWNSAIKELEKEKFERLCDACLEDFKAGRKTSRFRSLVAQYTKSIRHLELSARDSLDSCQKRIITIKGF